LPSHSSQLVGARRPIAAGNQLPFGLWTAPLSAFALRRERICPNWRRCAEMVCLRERTKAAVRSRHITPSGCAGTLRMYSSTPWTPGRCGDGGGVSLLLRLDDPAEPVVAGDILRGEAELER
jgi:hypothetical protein